MTGLRRQVHTGADGDLDLFRRLYPDLRRMAGATAPAGVEPDDLVQAALVRTLGRPGGLAGLDNPGAYLRRAVLNAARDAQRAQRSGRRLLDRLRQDEAVAPRYPSDLALLDRLDPVDRAILYLSIVESWTFHEIASQLGIRPATARQRSSRALRRLREADPA